MSALRAFVSDLLEAEGAAIDPVDPDGLDVLAPEPMRAAFGWSQELTRLGFGATRPHGAVPVGLEGDWLERFGGLLAERGRLAERQLPRPDAASPNAPERLIERALELPNAVWRLADTRQTWTRCLLLAFRYSATSDEKRDGLIRLGFNLGTGAVLGPALLSRLGALLADGTPWLAPTPEALAAAGAGALEPQGIAARTAPLLERRVRDDLDTFLRSMRRRLDRDCCRVHAYHDELRQAALGKLAKLRNVISEKALADHRRETLRVAAIEREYAAKIDDLRHKYALQTRVEWVQGLILLAPVQRFEILIKRRKGERVVAMDWHASVRLLEAPLDEAGLGLDGIRLVCDDRLHLTGQADQACRSCGKACCRACHPTTCPRCKQKFT
jgi:hypothetical protein